MYYDDELIAQCSKKLQGLLWQQDKIDSISKGSLELEPVLIKIIRLAKEEKLGFVYISAIYDMMFFQTQDNEPRKVIQYAELFLREGRAVFEESLSTSLYPDSLRHNYIACFELIGNVYMKFYQISTQKMEQFFNLYLENTRLYGKERFYYECRLTWEINCHNIKAAEKTCKRYQAFPLDGICYVCANEQVNQTRIFLGDIDGALAHANNIISGNIPAEAQKRYERCGNANAYYQYYLLFNACLDSGRIDLLDRVLPLIYNEILADEESDKFSCYDALVYALHGNFVRFNDRLENACNDIDEMRLYTPYDNMYHHLIWMTYFRLFYKSGIERIPFKTEKPIPLEADANGEYGVLEIADYFEKLADDMGAKFEKSREMFNYNERKECFHRLISN